MNLAARFVRVAVSGALGWLFVWLTSVGVVFPESLRAELEPGLIVLAGALVNAAVGFAAKKWPAFEWLLGVGLAPTYGEPMTVRQVFESDTLDVQSLMDGNLKGYRYAGSTAAPLPGGKWEVTAHYKPESPQP